MISAFIQFCVCHIKDQECFPTEKSRISTNSELSIDLTHTYRVQYSSDPISISETVKSEKRITLSDGESTIVDLYAAGNTKFNPREIFIRNNNGKIDAAMASMDYFYNSVLVDSTILEMFELHLHQFVYIFLRYHIQTWTIYISG